MVKIPLIIEDSLWVADLYTYDKNDGDLMDGGYCMIDNNSAATVIYSTNLTGEDEWFDLD